MIKLLNIINELGINRRIWDFDNNPPKNFNNIKINDRIISLGKIYIVDELDEESYSGENYWYKVLITHDINIKDEEDEDFIKNFSETDINNYVKRN